MLEASIRAFRCSPPPRMDVARTSSFHPHNCAGKFDELRAGRITYDAFDPRSGVPKFYPEMSDAERAIPGNNDCDDHQRHYENQVEIKR